MNSVEFLKLLARRWYFVLAGLVITLAVAFVAAGPSTVYFTRTTVNVLQPDRGKVRIVGFHSPDQIAVANLLAARVNGGVKTPLASDPDVTLPSMGIRHGSYAQVRNVGGQWLSQVTEPVVDVQSVAASEPEARQMLATQVADVGRELTKLEDQLKVPAADRIQLTLNPSDPAVEEITTPHSRALVGYTLFGLVTTLWATWALDRLLARRSPRTSRRAARGASAATA